MHPLKTKIAMGLCLWILAIQSVFAFTTVTQSLQVADGSTLEYKESPSFKLFFHQSDVFELQTTPQDRISLTASSFLSSTALFSETEQLETSAEEFFVRDQKYGLTILVFPFHFFW